MRGITFQRLLPGSQRHCGPKQSSPANSCAMANKPQHLEKALKPAVTFDSIADAWESKRLPLLHNSSRAITPSRLRNHVRPFFGNMPIEDIRTGTVNDWIRSLTAKKLKPKTIHNVWKDFRAIVNWHRKQMDEPKVTW
jgi:hypothetical protein